jgi:hypothetical protein
MQENGIKTPMSNHVPVYKKQKGLQNMNTTSVYVIETKI